MVCDGATQFPWRRSRFSACDATLLSSHLPAGRLGVRSAAATTEVKTTQKYNDIIVILGGDFAPVATQKCRESVEGNEIARRVAAVTHESRSTAFLPVAEVSPSGCSAVKPFRVLKTFESRRPL